MNAAKYAKLHTSSSSLSAVPRRGMCLAKFGLPWDCGSMCIACFMEGREGVLMQDKRPIWKVEFCLLLVTPRCSTMIQLSKWITFPELGKNITFCLWAHLSSALTEVCLSLEDSRHRSILTLSDRCPFAVTPFLDPKSGERERIELCWWTGGPPLLNLEGEQKKRMDDHLLLRRIRCRIYN